jgi:predicted RNA polymerase sigma factor
LAEAADAYRRAIELTESPVEQSFLERRLAEIDGKPSAGSRQSRESDD